MIQQRLQTYKQTLLVTQRGHSNNTKDAYLPRSIRCGRTSALHNIPAALLHTVLRHISLTATIIQQRLQTYKQTLLVTQRGHSKNTKDAYLPRSIRYGRTSALHNIPAALLHTVLRHISLTATIIQQRLQTYKQTLLEIGRASCRERV